MRVRVGISTGAMMALALLIGFLPAWAGSGSQGEEGEQSKEMESGSRLSDIPLPLQVADVPDRPTLLLELGEPFLGTGAVRSGS